MKVKNWKTTVAGILAAMLVGLHAWKPEVFTTELTSAISTILVSLGLLAAKDSNVTGGNVQQ